MNNFSFRRDWVSRPVFKLAQHALPSLSDTEREAIEAGDIWWDAELFSGNPDWNKLLAFPRNDVVMAKVLQRRTGRAVELASLNPEHPPRTVPLVEIDWMARIIWASQ